jgi:predicted XRE-type DNA-binding protein
MTSDSDDSVHVGSGNVFADLGLPNPEERLLKAQIMHAIGEEIKRQGLTQVQAAKKVGLAQPDLSRILNGRASNYSTERLLRVLLHLGRNIEIVLSDAPVPVGVISIRKRPSKPPAHTSTHRNKTSTRQRKLVASSK